MKTTCATFVTLLHTLHEAGITTASQLKSHPQLYARVWQAAKQFCHFALLSKTGKKVRSGQILPGNVYKMDLLARLGNTTREDLEMDCLIRIMEKLDRILQQPLEKQKNYCYTICNNMVNDRFRKLPPDNLQVISLDSPLPGGHTAAEEAGTYGDMVPDYTYNPERLHLERESVKELSRRLKAQRAREREERKAALLREVSILSHRSAEVMVWLACTYLGMKPRQLASLILDKGCDASFAEILLEAAQKNQIQPEQICGLTAGSHVTEESVKADSKNQEAVASQISRLIYRADKRLHR